MKNQLQYQFNFARLITQEYALIERNFAPDEKINVVTKLHWGADKDKRVVGVAAKFVFEVKKQPFIIIRVEGQFRIEEATWVAILDEEKNVLRMDKGFMSHLAMLVVGSTRGVLHAKLENTPFNQIILPTMNVAAMFKEDVTIQLAESLPM